VEIVYLFDENNKKMDATDRISMKEQLDAIKRNVAEQHGESFEKINLTGLLYGTKKSGNNFLTDGQAYILYLKAQ